MSDYSILSLVEGENIIQKLSRYDISDIGSFSWLQHHGSLEKLNMQAIMNATNNEDEFIKELLLSYDKLPVLVYDLILIDLWKINIFPLMIDDLKENSFVTYFVLFHEVTVCTLLETISYHSNSCENYNDSLLDLIDYCYRKLTKVVNNSQQYDDITEGKIENIKDMQDIHKQMRTIDFLCSVKSISILRYIIDNLNILSPVAGERMVNVLDIPNLLIQLIEMSPWKHINDKGVLKKFIDDKWVIMKDEEAMALTKIEAQIWLSLVQLIFSNAFQNYKWSSYRKNIILKVRCHLNDILLDQLPILIQLRHYLEMLTLSEPPEPKHNFILEQLPEIWTNLERKYSNKWHKLAKKQCIKNFNLDKEQLQDYAKKLENIYSIEALESLCLDPPKCALCGEIASKKCSRCSNDYYCRRECQVKDWPRHKNICNLLFDNPQKMNITT